MTLLSGSFSGILVSALGLLAFLFLGDLEELLLLDEDKDLDLYLDLDLDLDLDRDRE